MAKSTMRELVTELEFRNKLDMMQNGIYDEIISEARAGYFHDYKGDRYINPKLELVNKLAKFKALEDIRTAVINGEYDESPDEEDKLAMKVDMIKDMGLAKAESLFKKLGLT